ncbi:MAG: hypothetical protein K2Q22_15705, partial [Cytophagales bacterium]|nr:hypothetical protein [Cytophagales bacterium]
MGKLAFDLFGEFQFDSNGWKFDHFTSSKKYDQLYNPDEIEVARTAKYFITNHDFLTDICFDRPNFHKKNTLWKTAFRPKFTVGIHVIGIKLYTYFHPEIQLEHLYDLPKDYFLFHALLILIVKNLFLAIALWVFYRQIKCVFNPFVAQFATLLLLIYPSVIYYVGLLNIYECIIAAGLVICLGQIQWLFENPSSRYKDIQLLAIGICLAIFGGLKSQVLLLNVLILACFIYLYLIQRKEKMVYLLWLSLPSIMLVVGVFWVNHAYFGQYTFSTQGALNFWHGHNPYAKGSWTALIWHQHWDEIQPYLEKNKVILSLDEATETSFYGKWALEWILHHPGQELFLIIKKTAILFAPHNMMKWELNPITSIFHLSLPIYLMLFLRHSLYNQAFHLFSVAIISG